MVIPTRNLVLAAGLLAVAGCASVDPEPDYQRARDEVLSATGEAGLFQPGDEELGDERIAVLLEAGVTSQEAVQISLLNNHELRASLFEIGLRRADVVQAGLLSNPSLGALVRFPVDDGSTIVEAGLVQNLIELWHLPARESLAEDELEQAVLEVAHAAAVLVADAKARYSRAVAARATVSVAELNLETTREFLDLMVERQRAGAATEVDVNAARSGLLEQEVLVRSARFAAFESKRQLALVLGLDLAPGEIELAEDRLSPLDWDPDLDSLLAQALEHRLDLRASRKGLDAAEKALVLQRRLLFRDVSAGISLESEGGDVGIGPVVELELPVFDQNQAQIAKAEYRYAQADQRVEALVVRVAQDVRGALEGYSTARDLARLYRDEILPLQEAGLELARESFAEGKTGFLSVLEAQSRLLAARRAFVHRSEQLALSLPELEAACGRSQPDLVGRAAMGP